jgi:hypothetical protein
VSTKKAIIYAVIAAVIGVIMGGVSRLFDVDFGIFIFIMPTVIFSALSGGTQVISKKKNDKK